MGKYAKTKEPFPGNYKFVAEVKPKVLECAAQIIIPKRTIEPWQVHYAPFKEIITKISLGGELWVQKPIWYANDDLRFATINRYGINDPVRIPANVPHRLINPFDKELTLIVESSPGPKHRKDLEPEFLSLTECIDALHQELIKNAIREYD
jgi:hypothetical protein